MFQGYPFDLPCIHTGHKSVPLVAAGKACCVVLCVSPNFPFGGMHNYTGNICMASLGKHVF